MVIPRRSRAHTLRAALAGLCLAGCGSDAPPAALEAGDDAARAAAIAASRDLEGERVVAALFKTAFEDENEFLRGKALEALWLRRPPGELAWGDRDRLDALIRDDPDFTKRNAALVLLWYQRLTSLRTVAELHRTTTNPVTRAVLAEAVRDLFDPETLRREARDGSRAVAALIDHALNLPPGPGPLR